MSRRVLILLLVVTAVALVGCNRERAESASPSTAAPVASPAANDPAVTTPQQSSGAPHGGVVESSGTYAIEFAQMNGYPAIYLLDQAGNGMPTAGLTAELIITRNGETTRVPLPSMGDHFMSGDPIDLTTPGTAVVSIVIAGNSLSAKFELPLKNKD